MKIEPIESLEQVKIILMSSDLPTEDIVSPSCVQFFGIFEDTNLLAIIGLELYGNVGLLRSLAVLPTSQHSGLGNRLVKHAESVAMQNGVEQLYLLTTTAEAYFLQQGYNSASRDEAPEAIKATSQFAGLCPDSAAFLSKTLGN